MRNVLPLALALLVGLAAASPAPAAEAPALGEEPRVALLVNTVRPAPRRLADGIRCTVDRVHCIGRRTYVQDVCGVVEAAAREYGLDPNFLARLLWKESLFDSSAVSPKGAQGIAQFMPGTAAMRGLADPFNPAEAVRASAAYLAELSKSLGNVGLAAVAYNGGEARAARFVAREAGLPLETRNYVEAITGHAADAWRDTPPTELDLRLRPEGTFRAACIAQASSRTFREATPPPPPWGVVLATNRDRTGAERQVARLVNRHRPVLGSEAVRYLQDRRLGTRGTMWYAQVPRETRDAADGLCSRLRAAGGDCTVLRN